MDAYYVKLRYYKMHIYIYIYIERERERERERALLGSVWLKKWKSERIENSERMEKWEDRKDFNFPLFCLIGSGKIEGWKKWVCINLRIYPY